MSDRAGEQVAWNRTAHDRAASGYERRHGEIFNDVEQTRLAAKVTEAAALLRVGAPGAVALDYGAGSGNVTRHLVRAGFRTIAADISRASLAELERGLPAEARCSTLMLEDERLPTIEDDSVDLATCYSVLHHVPDYHAAARELARVLRPGGVLYIDHEASPAFWTRQPAYAEWYRCRDSRGWYLEQLRNLTWNWPLYRLRRLRDARATEEGDLHVWPDDHIDWEALFATLRERDVDVVSIDDYLVYRRHFDRGCYERLRGFCDDTRAVLARKRGATG